MKISETTKLMMYINESFPQYAEKDEAKMKFRVTVWHEMLEDIPFEVALNAVKKHSLNNQFISIADIRNFYVDTVKGETMSGAEAWDIVSRKISSYSTREDYERLQAEYPDVYEVSRLLGGARNLVLGNVQYVRPEFEKAFETYIKAKRNNDLVPEKFESEMSKIKGSIQKALCAGVEEY